MGGVLRRAMTSTVYMAGEPNGEAIFHNGNEIWRKPIPSVYPIRGLSNTDNILFVGSSSVACLGYTNWHPREHEWLSVMRSDYQGSMRGNLEGRQRPGTGGAITLARMHITDIVRNAENNVYDADVNPLSLSALSQYNALLIDTSDRLRAQLSLDNNLYYANTNMPNQYYWSEYDTDQSWINYENQARMRLIRLAYEAGIDKMYLYAPWPRIYLDEGSTHTYDPVLYYNKFQSLEDSMHYQQDRLNAQMKLEGIEAHISLIPNNVLFKDIFEDIENGVAPEELEDIRQLFALENNTDPRTDLLTPQYTGEYDRSRYMLNYVGNYAINCLFDAIVLGGDTLNRPTTDGFWTVSEPIADYIKQKVINIRDNYPRSGRTKSGTTGFVMGKIRTDWPVSDLVPDALLVRDEPMVTNQAYPLVRNAPVHEVLAVMRINTGVAGTERSQALNILGSGYDGVNLLLRSNGTDRLEGDLRYTQLTQIGSSFINLIVQVPSNLILFNLILPATGSEIPFGDYEMMCMVMNMELDDIPWQRRKTTTSRQTASQRINPISNRAITPDPNFVCEDLVVMDRNLTDIEKFNIIRQWQIKYQLNLWEPLWPDIIRP